MLNMSIRPKFRLVLSESEAEIRKSIESKLNTCGEKLRFDINEYYIIVMMPKSEEKMWTPRLTITFDEIDGATLVRGRMGPPPNIWNLYAFLYFALGFFFLFVSIYGFSQMSLGHNAPVLWLLPVISLLIIAFYMVSQIGQKKASKEVEMIKQFCKDAISDEVQFI